MTVFLSWSVEPAAHGDGTWLVAEDRDQVLVFAAPGVRVPSAASTGFDDGGLRGWRCSVWDAGDDVMLDLDLPRETTSVATAELCAMVPEHVRAHVREVLVSQLSVALCFGEAHDGWLIRDDVAHARQSAAVWLVEELRAAFPEEAWQLPRSSVLTTALIPDTADELLAALPLKVTTSQDPDDVVDKLLEAGELLRLLSVVVLRRITRAFGRLAQRRRDDDGSAWMPVVVHHWASSRSVPATCGLVGAEPQLWGERTGDRAPAACGCFGGRDASRPCHCQTTSTTG